MFQFIIFRWLFDHLLNVKTKINLKRKCHFKVNILKIFLISPVVLISEDHKLKTQIFKQNTLQLPYTNQSFKQLKLKPQNKIIFNYLLPKFKNNNFNSIITGPHIKSTKTHASRLRSPSL